MTSKRETLRLPEPKQQDMLESLDSLLTERKPANPAPKGITTPQPLEPPCLQKSHSRSSSS
jgi:hypothetical protein